MPVFNQTKLKSQKYCFEKSALRKAASSASRCSGSLIDRTLAAGAAPPGLAMAGKVAGKVAATAPLLPASGSALNAASASPAGPKWSKPPDRRSAKANACQVPHVPWLCAAVVPAIRQFGWWQRSGCLCAF